MFFTLGFVVWRIRRILDTRGIVQKVPEILPMGTFTWTVRVTGEDDEEQQQRDGNLPSHIRMQDQRLKRRKETKRRKRSNLDNPVLYYDIELNGIDCEFYVYEYIIPDLTMQCISPLSSIIPLYIRLQISRTCRMRGEEWNSSARFAVEHEERMQQNQLAEDGAVLNQTITN